MSGCACNMQDATAVRLGDEITIRLHTCNACLARGTMSNAPQSRELWDRGRRDGHVGGIPVLWNEGCGRLGTQVAGGRRSGRVHRWLSLTTERTSPR
jgi:hypothetical protein